MTTPPKQGDFRSESTPRRVRYLMALLVVIAAAVILWTNQYLMLRFTETTRSRAEVRLALYSGNILSELQRNQIVPQLLARDPTLIGALNSDDFSQSSQRLIEYRDEIGAEGMLLMDAEGRAVAATDRSLLGSIHKAQPYFIEATRSNDTVFTTSLLEAGGRVFAYSRRIEAQGTLIGVIMVEVDLKKFETSWAGFTDAVIVSDSEDTIILATEARWRGLTEKEALAVRSVPSAIERAFRATARWGALPADAYLQGEAVMRQEARIGFQGWKIASFTTYAGVRERVNAVLALEIMGFAILMAMAFYLVSRKATSRLVIFQRESAELRQLNAALQREIAEREKAERHLEVAEQTLQQSSKLAALGEMSAAVSHELNQPLAAMKTYLAGAKLLLQRRRADEALSSFQRIDDLIERMGAITRQLKSYARKGGDAFEIIDVRDSVSSALSMMEPQLRRGDVDMSISLPRNSVYVRADRIRFEQVLVNLLRNALDATKGIKSPEVKILVTVGDDVVVTVRDNGSGIEDLESLFEPFYTTKSPGDGVGLGLAISSGIVNDLGGRLTARNGRNGGAVFEITLPLVSQSAEAAE
ncbi:sensor histidine kinase [Silicimonas algicola]|uniref:C4-dicarboxylate transport sensor protein DctB n=1 Tax=Silicimonas algicola TaxID=1826607 RepID=A0A316GGV7_9RHOB|nr:ATP-binding protein [Silicimonas algicola]AZQ66290.1 sensor histidine kinase [Silicimonas algicola]PWK58610.1 two-component system C4-dicarboxylate transport sensor histidine kinase DctB [Silicimonas algicola]